MDALRVLIADDHPIFRNGMRALLTSVPGIEVAGEAVNGDEARPGNLSSTGRGADGPANAGRGEWH